MDKNKLSPMMQHYLQTKEECPDAILFYRLGDFYEMFFEDAVVASRILELTLTGKDCGLEKRAPMCGVPYHAAKAYIAKLVDNGYKVAICEQLTVPGETKGLVERGIIQIVTPGTVLESDALDSSANNFLMSIYLSGNNVGVCYGDISTGLLEMTECAGEDYIKLLDDILVRVRPREIITNEDTIAICGKLTSVANSYVPSFEIYEGKHNTINLAKSFLLEHFNVQSLSVFDAENKKYGVLATARLLDYVFETQKRAITNLKKLVTIKDENYVHLDIAARRNLELVENMSLRKKYGSLLWLLDQTKTCMGARKMRSYIDKPLRSSKLINDRLSAVEELRQNYILRESLQEALMNMGDIERKCGKISANTILPKEMYSLASSLDKASAIKGMIANTKSKLLNQVYSQISDMTSVAEFLRRAISQDAPAVMKDGGYIASGYNEELDNLRNAKEYGKVWLANLEQSEKEKTGIKNLKTGYNRVFGYYIEVTNGSLANVPDYYIRKQTTTTAERFIIPELKEMEYKILNSTEEALKIESDLYAQIKQTMQGYLREMLESSDAIATLDCLLSFAVVSAKNNYCKPVINDKVKSIDDAITGAGYIISEWVSDNAYYRKWIRSFIYKNGVIKSKIKKGASDDLFDDQTNIMLITGPNMAGKSTYMRQVAIITLMAHMGCFVPASSAEIAIVDRIFTRVGATDELAFGQSTFMVEMNEVSNIISNATNKSLIILDEVGRGTSTYDGLSIAWAIMEYIANHIGAKTLFSTHYHELTSLEGQLPGVKNYKVMVKEFGGDIIFLHKIGRGSANRSFGIEVAKLAGLPEELLSRAKQILEHEEQTSSNTSVATDGKIVENIKPQEREVLNIIKELDINNIPPIVAFTTLSDLIEKLKK